MSGGTTGLWDACPMSVCSRQVQFSLFRGTTGLWDACPKSVCSRQLQFKFLGALLCCCTHSASLTSSVLFVTALLCCCTHSDYCGSWRRRLLHGTMGNCRLIVNVWATDCHCCSQCTLVCILLQTHQAEHRQCCCMLWIVTDNFLARHETRNRAIDFVDTLKETVPSFSSMQSRESCCRFLRYKVRNRAVILVGTKIVSPFSSIRNWCRHFHRCKARKRDVVFMNTKIVLPFS